MISSFKKIIFFLAIVAGIFLFGQRTLSQRGGGADPAQIINVNFTVPGGEEEGGGGGGGGDGSGKPAIYFSNISVSPSFTEATITWNIHADHNITGVSFVYGTTENYGNSANVTGNYQVELSGLATDTPYYYKISVTDAGNHAAEVTGTFSTTDPNAGPPPADSTPPVISNIQTVPGITTAAISWDTDEAADSQMNYGLTLAYGANYYNADLVLNHGVQLANLLPNRTYHFQVIATDTAGNSAAIGEGAKNYVMHFSTLPDAIPPPDVSNVLLTTTSNSIVLSWTNPSLVATPDFDKVKVVRKIGSPSNNDADGLLVYQGTQQNFTDFNIVPNTNYFYTIFSFDTSNNRSPGIFRNGSILPLPPAEICNNNIDDNNNGAIDCADAGCAAFAGCQQNNPPTSTPEVCNNNLDDNANGKTDCADAACAGFAGCMNNPAALVCNNGIDDDSDGKKDFPDDPGCESAQDNDEYNAPEPTVPSFLKINISDLSFWAGNRNIQLFPNATIVAGLYGANLSVGIPGSVLENNPKSMILRVGDTDTHQFVFNITNKIYYADISFSRLGTTQVYIEIDYGSGQFDSVGFKLQALPWGQITDEDGHSLSGAIITLLKDNDEIVPMGEFGQLNPINSDINGGFGWLVPNGNYKISIQKEGYYSRSLNLNEVSNNVINKKLNLITLPRKLEIDPEASLGENIKNVAGTLFDQTQILSTVGVQKLQDAITDPGVQKINTQVVAPAAITAAAVAAAPLISWVNLLPLLRLLFLQPLMLIGWRKREKWGQVYNSLNKMPVDLATVRLVNAETGRIVQSKVTDSKGRFIFMVKPGRYTLVAQKASFVFPSNFLAGLNSDGQKVDIYHGEIIEVKFPSPLIATVPLDPAGAQKKPSRLVWERFGRKLQSILSGAGIAVTAVSLYISPKWYIAGLLVAHVAVLSVVRKLAIPTKVKNWGLVSDQGTKKPISRVVARLFNSQFNKLVDMQVTDSDGKYHFIAGDAKYYITYEHAKYHPQKTDIIDLEGKDAEVITKDISLKKQ